MQYYLDKRNSWEKERFDSINEEIFFLTNNTKDKDIIISKLRGELDKVLAGDIDFHNEIFICEPIKKNMENINENIYTKNIICEIDKIYKQEKIESLMLDNEIEVRIIKFFLIKFFWSLIIF